MIDARLAVLQNIADPHLYGDLRNYVELGTGADALAQLRGSSLESPVIRGHGDHAWLAFTSGSTGTPRAAVHTRASLEASTETMGERYDLGPDDAVLVAAPVGHAIGFCYGVRLAADRGCRLVLQARWDPEVALDAVSRHECTFAAIPTPFLADLVALGRGGRGTLRHLLVGGAPVPRGHLVRADELFGRGVASAYYGSSECGAAITVPPGASEEERLSSDGLAMPGMEVKIADDQGEELPPGSSGELVVRGPQVARGYWMNNDSDHQFLPDGWFATRDLAERRESGFVRVTGRSRDVIIRGAVNVAPREVEEAISAHPRVSRAVVVGLPEERLGEAIVAVIMAEDAAPDKDELRRWLEDCGVARSKWPDVVDVVDELPRGPTGKIDRDRIRDDLLRRTSVQ